MVNLAPRDNLQFTFSTRDGDIRGFPLLVFPVFPGGDVLQALGLLVLIPDTAEDAALVQLGVGAPLAILELVEVVPKSVHVDLFSIVLLA